MQFIFVIMTICWLCFGIDAAPQQLLKQQIPSEKLKLLAIDKPAQPQKVDFGDNIIGKKFENQIGDQLEKGRPRLYPLFPDVNPEDLVFYSQSNEVDEFNNPMPMYMPPKKNYNGKIAANGK